jgi:dolichyl-phosphate beta-glucosyltransferase
VGRALSLPAFTLVVPCYDEARRFDEFGQALVDFVGRLPAGSELIFVDDGSSDTTGLLASELIDRNPDRSIRLIRRGHEGKGRAVVAGLRAGQAPYAAFCDLDLSTPLDQLERVMRAASRAPVLALGSRDLASSVLIKREGLIRETLGRTYNRLIQATLVPGVVDTQCGAKAAAHGVWDRILPECRERGYAWDAEAVAVARALQIAVQEVPVEWSHDDRSKVRLLRDGAAMVWATGRIARNVRRVRASAARQVRDEWVQSARAELQPARDSDGWWFRSKAAVVATVLRRTTPAGGDRRWFADLGGGSGDVTSMIGLDPNRLVVVDVDETLVKHARRHHGLGAVRANLNALPIRSGALGGACLLDVLEHLDDPHRALAEVTRVLAPGGRLVVNVPAHLWLWSQADEFLGHRRRYTWATLRRELEAAGLEPQLHSHVFSWLVAPVWVTRRVISRRRPRLSLGYTSPIIDRVAIALTFLERSLLGRVRIPWGTSLLCVASLHGDPDPASRRPESRAPSGSVGSARDHTERDTRRLSRN